MESFILCMIASMIMGWLSWKAGQKKGNQQVILLVLVVLVYGIYLCIQRILR